MDREHHTGEHDEEEYDAEAEAERRYFDMWERRDEIMGFHDDEPPEPDEDWDNQMLMYHEED